MHGSYKELGPPYPLNTMLLSVADAVAGKRRKVKMPDKKKYDEEMEAFVSQIKEKETQLVRSAVISSFVPMY